MTWASYQIRKIAGCACAGNARNVFPRRRFQRKPLVSDPDMHHGTCVTHVPWCMSGSLTCGNGENVPGIPGACAPGILRIWQEAHGVPCSSLFPFLFRSPALSLLPSWTFWKLIKQRESERERGDREREKERQRETHRETQRQSTANLH